MGLLCGCRALRSISGLCREHARPCPSSQHLLLNAHEPHCRLHHGVQLVAQKFQGTYKEWLDMHTRLPELKRAAHLLQHGGEAEGFLDVNMLQVGTVPCCVVSSGGVGRPTLCQIGLGVLQLYQTSLSNKLTSGGSNMYSCFPPCRH